MSREQAIKEFITGKYTKDDDARIQDAVGDQRRKNLVANLGDAFSTIATARGVANGAQRDDGSFWQGMKAQGKAGVDQAQAAREAKIKGFLQNNELQRQVSSDSAKATEAKRKASGKLNQGEIQGLVAKGASVSDKPFEGGVPYYGEDGVIAGYVGPKRGASPAAKTRSVDTVDASGKPITKIVEDKPGSEFQAYQKPEKAPEDKSNENSTTLRKEYDSHPTTKQTSLIVGAYDKIQRAATNPKPSPATDMSLVYSYMKLMDPGTGVKEGEYASAENTKGIPDTIIGLYNKAREGVRLTPQQRENFVTEAGSLVDSQLEQQKIQDERFAGYAKGYKLDPNQVIDPSFEKARATRAPKPETVAGGPIKGDGIANAAPAGPGLTDIEAEMAKRKLKPKTGATGGF
jgi:hypothetical protein